MILKTDNLLGKFLGIDVSDGECSVVVMSPFGDAHPNAPPYKQLLSDTRTRYKQNLTWLIDKNIKFLTYVTLAHTVTLFLQTTNHIKKEEIKKVKCFD